MPSTQSRKRQHACNAAPAVVPVSTPDITPRLLNVKQASQYSGATVWAIRELYWSKEVAGTIIGRRLLIAKDSLDAFINRKLAERAA